MALGARGSVNGLGVPGRIALPAPRCSGLKPQTIAVREPQEHSGRYRLRQAPRPIPILSKQRRILFTNHQSLLTGQFWLRLRCAVIFAAIHRFPITTIDH